MQTLGCVTGFSTGAEGVEASDVAELPAVVLRPVLGLPKRPGNKHRLNANLQHIG